MASDNLSIWRALEKTDPAATKGFKRSGGFVGTATKPIWNIKRMTEQFGPCGIGWGMTEPQFNVQSADGELLVFCTVGLWHSGDRLSLVYGVGGDKIVSKRQSGTFNNDEAFKSAYTDAQSNAMKQIGIGADIHMGLFDDHKYVREVDQEFRAAEQAEQVDVREVACNRIISALRSCEGTNQEFLASTWKRHQGEILVMSADQIAAVTKVKDEVKAKLSIRSAA